VAVPGPDTIGGFRKVGIVVWSLLGTLLLLGAVGWVLVRFAFLLPAVVLALVVTFVLNPVVSWLQERGLARWMGSCLSYLVLAGLLTAIGFLVLPSLADQGRQLADDFPAIYDDLVADLESFADRVGIEADLPSYDELRERIEDQQDGFFEDQLGRITEITLGVLETVLLVIIGPVIAFYLLLDLPSVRRSFMALVPERHRGEVAHVGRELGRAVGGFLRGQVLVALIVGVMTSVGFFAIDLPFWLLIGMIAGFLNIIPFVGPWVGGALGVGVALATRDAQTAVWAGLVALVVQQIDNHFVSPTVLRVTVRIHPGLIILGLIAGGSLFGFWGLVLAVPVMAATKIVTGHYWRTRVLGQTWEEASEALISEDGAPETLLARALRRTGEHRAVPPEPPDEPSDDGSPDRT
jgi:predicted PurR-regulated permease PerM